ncbi:hypothetical protein [Sphaerimonospora thailandensis]|uniref:Uncharacterized protein n=1 Tax=Sphaerimonospora thailandensis TaxID=795644 RepID=A0A8J3VZR6_9ACTN|nr:hypothetical protein [Sphaerimonospora thailandensis]GIH70742.1 hypothetical protein Mth01_29950 [Sphaerimonospora thailandensis]
MPICTAIIAAALLSGPVGTPADQHPVTDASPGKQVASFAMQNADQPELVASTAVEKLLKDKNGKIGSLVTGGLQEPAPAAQGPAGQAAPAAQTGQTAQAGPAGQQGSEGPVVQTAGQQEPQDIFLHPQANSPVVSKMSGKDLVQQLPGRQMREFGSGQWSSDDD